MIIDWQHHYFPEKLWKKLGGKPGEVVHVLQGGMPRLSLFEQLYRIDQQLTDMDNGGIDIAVLSCTMQSLEDSRMVNDDLSKVMKNYPDRFVGIALASPLGGKPALDEMERAIKDLGLRGVLIESQIDGYSLDFPGFWPFYQKAQELDIPIFVHVAPLPLGYDALNGAYDLHRMIGREFDLATATTRLILSGVLDEFPNLKFVIAHLGGGIALLKERIEYWEVREPIPGVKRPKKLFKEYLARLYFDTAGFTMGSNAIRTSLTEISPKQMIFGTDYPYIPLNLRNMKPYVENIKKLDLDDHAKEGILYLTAADLLKLSFH